MMLQRPFVPRVRAVKATNLTYQIHRAAEIFDSVHFQSLSLSQY